MARMWNRRHLEQRRNACGLHVFRIKTLRVFRIKTPVEQKIMWTAGGATPHVERTGVRIQVKQMVSGIRVHAESARGEGYVRLESEVIRITAGMETEVEENAACAVCRVKPDAKQMEGMTSK